MKSINIKLTRDEYNFRFKQYEGMFFHANINEDSDVIRYKITKDKEGNTHIKDNMLFIPQIDAYLDLKKIK